MAKRGKVGKAVSAEATSSGHDEPSTLPSSAVDADKTEPARKRARAAQKQQQQQQQQQGNHHATQDAALKADQQQTTAKPGAASRAKKQQKQQKQQQASDGQEEPEASKPQSKINPKAKKGVVAAAAAGANAAASKPPYYLVKSEPSEFSIEDLEAKPNQTEPWEGVRNAQARNIMRGMNVGDLAFFYHSSCKVPGIVGIAKVVREAYPDPTAFAPSSKYHDPSSTEDNPKWWMVDWQLVRKLKRQITLEELKSHKDGALEGMALFNRPRLSVQPVTEEQWRFIMSLEDKQDD